MAALSRKCCNNNNKLLCTFSPRLNRLRSQPRREIIQSRQQRITKIVENLNKTTLPEEMKARYRAMILNGELLPENINKLLTDSYNMSEFGTCVGSELNRSARELNSSSDFGSSNDNTNTNHTDSLRPPSEYINHYFMASDYSSMTARNLCVQIQFRY
ncbi:776_t:CDS:2 [Paraglomus occultum]|uniref:776_t:CDS:1 n=1 Tax=Paraglomus occultum TaxID=144539 RepID=A0A9N9G5N9_9GLOM|nr:776_t:CDS:2 [Paraglomus occultum]